MSILNTCISPIQQFLMEAEHQTAEHTVDYLPFYVPNGIIMPDVSDIPSEISYFLVVVRESPKIILKGVTPHVLTYKGDPTLEQLMGKYRLDTGYSHPKATHYKFAITSGIKLDPKFNIRDLKKMLARDAVDGMVLYVQFGTGPIDDEDEYTDECCVTDYFAKERQYGRRKNLWLRFEITLEGQPNTEVLYLQCTPYESKTPLLKKLLAELTSQFNLKDLTIERVVEASYISEAGKKAATLKDSRLSQQKLYNESTVVVRLSNPKKEVLKRVNAPKYNSWMVIYKENESQPIKVKYDDIANLTVSELYRSQLQLKESQSRRDMVYCLKIMDRILTPQEKINSAEVYFKNANNSKPLNVVAKVVNEKMIFYSTIPAIAAEKKAEFKLSEIDIPPNQQKRREECERTIRLRAEKAPHEYFKVAENVGPIVIYTSELMYKDRDAGQDLVIYQSLNKFLRETPILSLQKHSYQREWRLRYASTLLKHLQKTKPFEGDAWRGITYDPCLSPKDVGTVLSFKQFTSTSNTQEVAVSFARKHSKKEPYHLFAFKVKTGRSIIEYSIYEEGEILLEPYTEFELKSVTTKLIGGKQFKVYELEQRITSKRLPGIKANFVIWVDPNFKESRAILENLSLPGETTVFEQLKSTEELKAWLQRQKGLFKDETANLVFLTNMTRTEAKGANQLAGVDAARLIRQYSKDVPIFFYIGNPQAATNKLVASKLNLESIFIGSSPKEVHGFLELSVVGSV